MIEIICGGPVGAAISAPIGTIIDGIGSRIIGGFMGNEGSEISEK